MILILEYLPLQTTVVGPKQCERKQTYHKPANHQLIIMLAVIGSQSVRGYQLT